MSKQALSHCLNCSTPLHSTSQFCPQCGQKARKSKVRFKTIVGDFLSTAFNIDNRLWKSLALMFIPGELTRRYIDGHRRSHLNPIRLFLLMALFNFSALGILIDQFTENRTGSEYYQAISEQRMIDSLNVYIDSLIENSTLTEEDSIRIRQIGIDMNDKFSGAYPMFIDSLKIMNIKIPSIDTLLTRDLVELSDEELYEKYDLHGFLERMIFNQICKFLTDGLEQYISFLIANMLWVIIFLTPLLAFFMKLIYLRKKHYWVEHLIFQIDFHSLAFFLSGLCFTWVIFLGSSTSTPLFSITFGLILLTYFIALKRYYRQGFIKTLIKFFMILTAYFWILLILALLNMLLSVFLF